MILIKIKKQIILHYMRHKNYKILDFMYYIFKYLFGNIFITFIFDIDRKSKFFFLYKLYKHKCFVKKL